MIASISAFTKLLSHKDGKIISKALALEEAMIASISVFTKLLSHKDGKIISKALKVKT